VTRAAVVGAGSWGTAFAQVLVDAGTETLLWSRRPEIASAINTGHRNPDYLPDVELSPALRATHDAEEALTDAELVVLAIPSQTCRDNLGHFLHFISPGATVVSLMKGIELGTAKRMSEVIREVAGIEEERIAVVTGPNLAREIAGRQPAASVVACSDLEVAGFVQKACNSGYFRPYTNHDVCGCELGGAMKNVIALAVGIASGLGFGDNSQASLITRGLAEMVRVGAALGADPLTFSGLAGVGDLVATCMSPLSRNRTFGENLGRGMSVGEVVAITRQTAEGVKSCDSLLELARRHGVAVPITEHVAAVVHEKLTVQEMLLSILSKDPKHEWDHDV
jgi:glycerol-3-phosphate dehydrogenase (NAD(P)+)